MELQNLVSESIRTSQAILPASGPTFPYKKERESLLLSHDNTLYTAEKFIVCSKLFRVERGERWKRRSQRFLTPPLDGVLC